MGKYFVRERKSDHMPIEESPWYPVRWLRRFDQPDEKDREIANMNPTDFVVLLEETEYK